MTRELTTRPRRRTYSLYVVDLHPNVWHKRATMRNANPRYMPLTGKGYLYVGATSHTPKERFQIHKEGGRRSAPVVRIFGRALLPKLYAPYRRMSLADAEEMEPYLAERLRKKGYAVWPVKPGGLFTPNIAPKTMRRGRRLSRPRPATRRASLR